MKFRKSTFILLSLFSFMMLTNETLARTQFVDEYLIDDNFREDAISFLLKYSYKENEIENDNTSSQTDFSNSQELLGVEYNISKDSQLRIWLATTHNFSNGRNKRIYHDPTILYWKRLKKSDNPLELSGDLGVEISPSIGKEDLYKSKNGHQIAIKYRFGLGDTTQRVHGTYFIGFKSKSNFEQEGQKRDYETMTYWGLSLAGNYNLYRKIYGAANIVISRKSHNQAEAFYPNEGSGSSWETSYGLLFYLKMNETKKMSIGYRFKNESSAFNKFGNDLDIEDEQKSYFISFSQSF